MRTQNSGVMVEDGHVTYYGVIQNIVQLRYANGMLVFLFDCIWFNTDPTERGSIKRDYGLISVDTSTSCYEDWPYCLATTARPVFYLDDLKAGDSWKVVNVVAQRGTYSQRSLATHDEGSSDTHAVLISRQDHENPYQEDMPLHIANDLQPMDPNLDETPKRARRRLNWDEDDVEMILEHEENNQWEDDTMVAEDDHVYDQWEDDIMVEDDDHSSSDDDHSSSDDDEI
ncbi:unnamed protein product [Rhodiola kirilowii]